MGKWLRTFKFPSVERGTYNRLECTARHQIYGKSWATSRQQTSRGC